MAEILAIMVIGEKGSGGGSEEVMIRTRSGSWNLNKVSGGRCFCLLVRVTREVNTEGIM